MCNMGACWVSLFHLNMPITNTTHLLSVLMHYQGIQSAIIGLYFHPILTYYTTQPTSY